MKRYLIYLANNKVNGKKYIGQTAENRLERRIEEHLLESKTNEKNVAFHNAISKYGIENFTFEVIETDIAEKDIDGRERYWISYYNTYIHSENSNGYNETLGGQGTHGYIFTADDREKMGEKQKKYWKELKENDPEKYNALCEIRRQNKLGKTWSEESRRKLSESCKGKTPWNKGKKNSQVAWNKGKSILPNICKYDMQTGKLLEKYSTSTIAAESVTDEHGKIKTISNRIFYVAQHGRGHAYGFIWRFDGGCEQLSEIELQQELFPKHAKRIQQFDLSENLIAEYGSASEYARLLTNDTKKQRNIAHAINNVCRGNAKTYDNFI